MAHEDDVFTLEVSRDDAEAAELLQFAQEMLPYGNVTRYNDGSFDITTTRENLLRVVHRTIEMRDIGPL